MTSSCVCHRSDQLYKPGIIFQLGKRKEKWCTEGKIPGDTYPAVDQANRPFGHRKMLCFVTWGWPVADRVINCVLSEPLTLSTISNFPPCRLSHFPDLRASKDLLSVEASLPPAPWTPSISSLPHPCLSVCLFLCFSSSPILLPRAFVHFPL